jgi:hypothetical protein
VGRCARAIASHDNRHHHEGARASPFNNRIINLVHVDAIPNFEIKFADFSAKQVSYCSKYTADHQTMLAPAY